MFRLFRKKKEPKNEAQVQILGNQAKFLLENEAYQETMSSLEESIWADFLRTEADVPEQREVLYRHLTALRNIDNKLKELKSAGEASSAVERHNNAR